MGALDSDLIDQLGAQLAAQQPAPQAAPQAVQLPGPGDIFGALLNALGAPQAGMQAAVAQITGGGGQQEFRERREQEAQRVERGESPGAALPLMWLARAGLPVAGGLNAGMFRVGTELATDPLNFVGFGIPGRLQNLAQARNLSPAIITALQALARGEQGVQRGLQLPFDVLGAGVKAVGSIPGTGFGRTVLEQTPAGPRTRQATSLYDYLTSQSRETFMKQRGRNMVDAYQFLRQQGINLEDMIRGARRRSPQYMDRDAAADTIQTLERNNIARIDAIPDPRAQIAALDAIAQGDQLMAQAWEQALLPVQQAIDSGVTGQPLADLLEQADRQAFQESTQILLSIQDTIDNVTSQVLRAPAAPPTAAGLAGTGVAGGQSYLRHQLDQFYRNFDPRTEGQFIYTRGLQQRGERFARDIGNLTDRLRGAITAADPTAFLGPGREEIGRLVTRRREQLRTQQTGLPAFVAELPQELREVMTVEYNNFEGKLRQVYNARNTVEKIVNEVWQKNMPGTPVPPVDQEHLLQWASDTLQTAGVINTPLTATHELLANLSLVGQIGSNRINSLRRAVEQFPAGDLLSTDPFELVIDRVLREQAGSLGLTDQGALTRILSDVTAFYKEQALLSGNYPITNTAGGLFMGLIKGVNPLRVMRNLAENAAAMRRGEPVQTASARNFGRVYGESFGEGTRQSTGILEATPTREFLRRGITASQRIGGPRLAAGYGGLGAVAGYQQTPSDADEGERARNIAIGALSGATGGAIMPWLSKQILVKLGSGIETVMRETAAVQGGVQYMAQQGDRLRTIANTALTGTTTGLRVSPRGRVVSPVTRTPAAGNVAAAAQEIEARIANASAISPDELHGLLRAAGVQQDRALRAANEWREVVREGVRTGTEFSNSIHFDYQNLNNLEQFMKAVLPFSTWAAKALPFFVEEMAQHPIILTTLLDINQQSKYEMEKRGLTGRFAGALPADFASGLFSALIGRQATPWFDPTRGFLPFSGAARQFGTGTEDDPILKQVLNRAAAFGPGPHPLIELGMRTSGLLGEDEPSRGYLRQGQPLAGLQGALGVNRGQGIDVNAPIMAAESGLRRTVGGQDPANIRTSLTSRRIDEMALEATGKNIRSGDPAVAPYVQAKVRQAGPLWDQAARQVSRERGTQSLIGFGYGLASPQALLGTTEAGIREAQLGRIVPRELSDVVRRTAEREPSAIMSPEVVQQVRDAAQAMSDRNPALGGKIPEPVELLLTSAPTARNLQSILGQITEAQAMLENPAIQGYSGGGSPTEQQLSALLNQYNNIGAVLEGQSPQQIESVAQLSRTYQHPALRAQGAGGAHGIVLRGLQQRKDALRKANPLLDEYLNYQALKQGQGTVEDFLSNYYGKQRIPPQVP